MIEKGIVTQVEFQKHIKSNWRQSHGIWEKIRNYVPNHGYSKAEIDALLANMVSSAAVLADHTLLRGDGGVRGIQDSGITVDDNDNLVTTGTIRWSEFVHDVTVDFNLFLGKNAGAGIQAGGQYNVFVGEDAGAAITTGDGDTFIGYKAGEANAEGRQNTFIGESAGKAMIDGRFNFALGRLAFPRSESSVGNCAIGSDSLYYHTTGNNCVAIGYKALKGAVAGETGYHNVSIGFESMVKNTGGFSHVAIGSYALYSVVNARENVAVGYESLFSNQNGYYNVGVGGRALRTATGGYNTALGFRAGHQCGAGTYNVFLGYQAGYWETGSHKLYIADSLTATPLVYGEFDNEFITINGNLGIAQTTFGTNATKTLAQSTGVAPTTSPADCFQMYSADQVAGNACLHTRTEGGAVVKLFQATHINDAPGDTTANNATTINAILDLLEANGLMAT